MKKYSLIISISIFLMMFSGRAIAQTDTIRITTSSLCSTCKKAIEHDLSFVKGVKSSDVEVDAKIVTVVYDAKKTNPEKIKIAITKSGYDADSLKADLKAFNRLPDCCKDPDAHH